MFDPAQFGASLQPGDKVAMTFHKGHPKPNAGGPSFMDNVANQSGAGFGLTGSGLQSDAIASRAPRTIASAMETAPLDVPTNNPSADRQALMMGLRQRMGLR